MNNWIITVKGLMQKKSIKNGAWLYFLQIFNTLIPLITLPYITRILGTSDYGSFSIALNFLGYLQVVVEYGFGMSATRKIVLIDKGTEQKMRANQTNHLFSTVIYARILLLLLAALIGIVYSITVHLDFLTKTSLYILIVGLIGNVFQQNWLFQGKQDMKFISIVNITARLISMVCIFAFVHDSGDLFLYCIIYSGTTIFNGFFGMSISMTKYNTRFIKASFKEIFQQIKDGWYVFTTSMSSKVFGAIGVTFLGLYATKDVVGIYSAVQKIPQIILMVWSPIAQVLYPISSSKLSDSYLDGKRFIIKIRKYIMMAFGGMCLLIAIFSEPIVKIAFGAGYETHFYWILPLLIWDLIGIDNNFLGIQILLGSKHDKEYSKCFLIGVLATVSFNFVLIYCFGGNGASIAPLLSELILNIMLRISIRKIDKNNRSE